MIGKVSGDWPARLQPRSQQRLFLKTPGRCPGKCPRENRAREGRINPLVSPLQSEEIPPIRFPEHYPRLSESPSLRFPTAEPSTHGKPRVSLFTFGRIAATALLARRGTEAALYLPNNSAAARRARTRGLRHVAGFPSRSASASTAVTRARAWALPSSDSPASAQP